MSLEYKPISDTGEQLLDVRNLSVSYHSEDGAVPAVRDVSFSVNKGEVLGIAGQSGSGKSTVALALFRALDQNGEITNGEITLGDTDVLDVEESVLQSLRGNEISHVAQHPGSALNPSITIGDQIAETIRHHQDTDSVTSDVEALLGDVNIPDPQSVMEQYPHELSGGMQQRVLVAIALSCDPDLLVLDEPTTGLDVTTQDKILHLLKELKSTKDIGMIVISHDLGVMAKMANRVAIMYAGEIVESGDVSETLGNPAHPYTQGLLAARPDVDQPKDVKPIPGRILDPSDLPQGCTFADRCDFAEPACRSQPIEMESIPETNRSVRCRRWETTLADPIEAGPIEDDAKSRGERILTVDSLTKYFDNKSSFLDRFGSSSTPVKAVDGIDFEIARNETVGLVGESGCGKSTFGKLLLDLLEPTSGSIRYRGTDIHAMSGAEKQQYRSEVRIIFQDPSSSLNPEHTVQYIIERPMKKLTDLDEDQRHDRAIELLDQVKLSEDFLEKYPHQLSGGEKQRVSIARAFAANPSLIVLDEPVSALDVSVQASILNLLQDLQDEYDTSYLLISHDLSVVKHICDRVSVMYLGKLVETGTTEAIFSPPYHPYTRSLLNSVPSISVEQADTYELLEGDVPSPRNPPDGCSFHTRCPQKIGEVCTKDEPCLEPKGEDASHEISCHLDVSEMDQEL